jgi:type VI secretion system protein ImpF
VKGVDHESRIVPSVLDRLIDQEPKNHRDVLPSRAQGVRELRRAVQRDLESLLNSRNTFFDLPPAFAEAGQSVLTYGLPDFSTMNIATIRDQNRVRHLVEVALRRFEPRLIGVTVSIAPATLNDRSLRLHVDARLVMEPSPTPISFDIHMPQHTRKYEVKEGE